MPMQFLLPPFTPNAPGAPRTGHDPSTTLVECEAAGAAAEPDLDFLLRLLDPATYKSTCPQFHPPWVARREAACVALCWIAGVRPYELHLLKRRDWRPDRSETLTVDYQGRHEQHRRRTLPLLDAAAAIVEAYLHACPHPIPPDGSLLVRWNGEPFRPIDCQSVQERVGRASDCRSMLAQLAGRYRLYVSLSDRADGSVERLTGADGPYSRQEPDLAALSRTLRAAHPLGRERNIMGRLRALREQPDRSPLPPPGRPGRHVRER
ncbi:MAG: hypothetical protein WAU78_17395 [Roseiarcus sp.]